MFFNKTLNTKNTFLKPVSPTRTLLIRSMPCEERAAHIRNQTIVSLENNDVAEVSFRYIQSKAGFSNAGSDAVRFGLFILMSLILINIIHNLKMRKENPNLGVFLEGMILLPTMALLMLFLPSTSNALRYYQTKEGCASWLRDNMDINCFSKLDELVYIPQSNSSLPKLKKVLEDHHIDAFSLNKRIDCKFQ